jgi:hypothetical protein
MGGRLFPQRANRQLVPVVEGGAVEGVGRSRKRRMGRDRACTGCRGMFRRSSAAVATSREDHRSPEVLAAGVPDDVRLDAPPGTRTVTEPNP